MRRRVAETAALEGWAGDLHASVDFLSLQVPPFTAPASGELLAALEESQRRVTGERLERRAIAGFGDLRHYQLAGATLRVYDPPR